ncbi:MAG: molybdopterin-dependent oxidoreductase [Chloroflexaceae bacterium]|nr:molybdopterin-dependent oxidoreductase [Chloroflexaceae bacterium]
MKPISRRRFLKLGAGTSLVLGVYLTGCANESLLQAIPTPPPPAPAPIPSPVPSPAAAAPTAPPMPAPSAPAPTPAPTGPAFAPSAWLAIDTNGVATITVGKPDMGQGVRTALAMLLAEELELDWQNVRVEQAPADRRFGNQMVAGSASMRQLYGPLRQAGASALAMLLAAAAQQLQVDAASLKAEKGIISHAASGRSLRYGELVPVARTLPVPASAPLKAAEHFRLIGKPTPRVDNAAVATGQAIYGMDVRLPTMRYAVVARPPSFGSQVASFNADSAKAVPGVTDVVQIGSGVAVVASNTWAAFKGREALQITWQAGPYGQLDSAAIAESLRAGVSEPAAASAAQLVEASYDLPYLAHAPMEPMNCVADVRADSCELWVGTQSPGGAQAAAARMLGLPAERVTVNVTLLGGGFGRRADTDFVEEAVAISQAVGAPVKLVWSRADDMQHGSFRPISHHRLRGGLDGQGNVVAWSHRIATPGIGGMGGQMAASNARLPYSIRADVDAATVPQPVPTWFWRAVFSSQNGFVNESFLDELAAAANRDPFTVRRDLAQSPRLRTVLELAAEKAGWGAALPAGQGRGIAAHVEYGSFAAVVAEVRVDGGAVRVQRVVVAVDCGVAVNPLSIAAQVEGCVADGVSTTLKSAITIAGGQVQQTSFADYGWLRIGEMPVVETHLVPSSEEPGGIGELVYPAVPPALANAIFAASDRRVRRLPVRAEDL